MDPTFAFNAELWLWQSETATAWVFVSLPTDASDEIADVVEDAFGSQRRGFGSVKVRARVLPDDGTPIEWSTSLFPSTEKGCYLLPIKKEIRRKARIDVGDPASFEVDIQIT